MGAVSVDPTRPEVPAFVLLTLVGSWLVWVPLASTASDSVTPAIRLVGAFVPSVVAVLLSVLAGRAVFLGLLNRLRRWRIGLR